MVCHFRYLPVSSNLDLLLHEDFLHNSYHQQRQVQDHVQQPNQTNQLNIGRYRKAVSTALWLQFVLVTCYLPFAISLNLLFHLHLLPSLGVIFNFSFLKLVVKPDSLLLEEGRSETRTEGHNQASALLLIK